MLVLLTACVSGDRDGFQSSVRNFIDHQAKGFSAYQPVGTVAIDTFYNDASNLCAYEFLHTCMLKNNAGETVMKNLYILSDPELNVIEILDDPYQRSTAPCDRIALGR